MRLVRPFIPQTFSEVFERFIDLIVNKLQYVRGAFFVIKSVVLVKLTR